MYVSGLHVNLVLICYESKSPVLNQFTHIIIVLTVLICFCICFFTNMIQMWPIWFVMCLLELECDSQQWQLHELQRKYVMKILLADMNLRMELVVGKMHAYDNIPENTRKRFGTKEHLVKMEGRIKTLSLFKLCSRFCQFFVYTWLGILVCFVVL